MISCDQSFSLTVQNTNCPDWTQLAWGVPFVSGNASIVPAAAGNSNIFQLIAANPGSCQNDAQIIYNGHGCNCNLHLVYTWVGASTGLIIINDITAPLGLINRQVTSFPPGTVDLPFTLPDTLGLPHTITVHVQAQAIGAGFSVNFTGTLSNV